MTTKLRNFLKLENSEKFIVIEASIFLIVTSVLLKLFGIRKTQNVLCKLPSPKSNNTFNELSINNLNRLIKSASGTIPCKTKCIEEAITMWTMLRTRGVESYLKIGVKDNEKDFKAHAWVETNGIKINFSDTVDEKYSEFDYKFFIEPKNK